MAKRQTTRSQNRRRLGPDVPAPAASEINGAAIKWCRTAPEDFPAALTAAGPALRVAGRAMRGRPQWRAMRSALARLAVARRELSRAGRAGAIIAGAVDLAGPLAADAGRQSDALTFTHATAGKVCIVNVPTLASVADRVVVDNAGRSALAVVYTARTVAVRPETRRDRRLLPLFRPPTRDVALPAVVDRSAAPLLPLFESDPLLRVPLLDMQDAAGVPVMAKGRGAPLAARLFVGAILMVRRQDRALPSVRLSMPLRVLVGALYPTGWRSANQWPRLAAALAEAHGYTISDGQRLYRPVSVLSQPIHPDLDAEVVIRVELPPGSDVGPPVEVEALALLSVGSAARWRATIAARSILWRPGRTRVPVPRRGGGGSPGGPYGWTVDRERYPVVSLAERRRFAFGPADRMHRTIREIDAAWSGLPGVRTVPAEPGRGFPRGAVRVLPAEIVADEDV